MSKHEPMELCLESNPGPCGECGADGQEVVKGTFLCDRCCAGPAGRRIATALFDAAARMALVAMGVDVAVVAGMDIGDVGERGAERLGMLAMGASRN